ncbi:c-type cytochrome [Variovorax sp. J22P240]|uniref:c-type cytochrome n=1 Tax=unclassified Variovorax TaxID=663243 RepID=UPI00257788C9|nr:MULTISPECIES: c-type cytochrome [unclassified Variovorax]MDM0000712.1 c-type cytochrome [Variovorax sp. J22P240]MDM0047491.1 c-type cytochrome [Variovorax sp. J22R115]
MRDPAVYSWRNAWFRWSVVSLVVFTVLCVLVGFVWLPSVHKDFTAQNLWDAICRAAGVPAHWSSESDVKAGPASTDVVLERRMVRTTDTAAVGRGATLALNCTMCHGAQGMSTSNAPNLSGQYPEVVIKQLLDYKAGRRSHTLMETLARNMSQRDIEDLAAYYAYLPKARTAPTTYDESLPALVRVGDPLRNIAPCISCHGGVDQKLGAPWIEGMPKDYLVEQLKAFKTGARRNDSLGQMRNMSRPMSEQEIAEVAEFYARKASAGQRD